MTSSRAFLFSLEQLGIKLGLEQIRRLMGALGHPHRAYPSIAIAGTNGKGSVTAMLERGLRAAGYRTGRYTSPHLVRLEERFAIDGADVAADALDEVLARVERAARTLPAPPSFFEATTAAALAVFADAKVDVALLEVGLGGRLDATNVVDAKASAITSIDFDHQAMLGDTLEAIAGEKAGIIKPASLCVLASNPAPVVSVIEAACRDAGARFVPAPSGTSVSAAMRDGRVSLELRTPIRHYATSLSLRGRHQVDNAVVTVRLLEELDVDGLFDVPAEAVHRALDDVVWPGRLELVAVDTHSVLVDGAHNAAGAKALAAFLRDTYRAKPPLVIGVLRDKDVDAILAALTPAVGHIVCTAPSSPRAMPAAELAAVAARVAPGTSVETSADARAAIGRAAAHGTPVVVAGSLFLAGEVRTLVS